MKSKGHLKTYNHLIVVTDDVYACNEAWAELFGYSAPPVYDTKEFFLDLDYTKYKTLYRGKNWHGEMKQAIIFQKTHLLELKQPGSEDCCREYYEKNGKGIPYFGIVEEENRNPFVERLQKEFGCDLVHDQKYPIRGDWCLLDTEKVLGCRLCIKEDGYIGNMQEPVMNDFSELWLVTKNFDLTVKYWMDIFDLPSIPVTQIETEGTRKGDQTRFCFRMAEVDGPYPFYLVENKPGMPLYEMDPFEISAVSVTFPSDKARTLIDRAVRLLHIPVAATFSLKGEVHTILDSRETLGTRLMIVEK